ncbi:MAG TPA: Asp-tRNA(Asn)/Glu-tRNA(Gln) amidotransferase subunit GatB [Candidatus Megaira endosymbiont of Hartmannula sinica]|nr:Asp-tRNA(Asn)/Glu-tRNA(Gln) amidotransferase subunit GatB [Candidatus Megaera endosymbiont of Hartmannula sinica]
MDYIERNGSKWEYVIGLEVHAQVISKTKLFSPSINNFDMEPNTAVSLIDAAMPGMLPVLNDFVLYQAIKTGIAINARINKESIFDRKNYFYPDLPQGYQISQFYKPIVEEGYLDIPISKDSEQKKRIRIERFHLEQDAGKSIHDQSPNYSFIDLNRAGVPLMEIVSYPDISSPYEAAEYIKKLRNILRAVESCDGNMEQGSFRCDANVSVRKVGDVKLGTRCEIKNLNSIKNITKAIEYEALRQIEILEDNGTIDQETRLFDTKTNSTKTMRLKEDANDYRYFPDPDLLPVKINQEFIDNIKNNMPELPDQRINRYVTDYHISKYDASLLSDDINISEYFESVIKYDVKPKIAANWIIGEMFALINKSEKYHSINDSLVKAEDLAELISLITENVISGKMAKDVFVMMFESGKKPKDIIKEQGLEQISDKVLIKNAICKIINDNPKKVEEYQNGKEKIFGFFVGQVMKIFKGKANPAIINQILREELSK